MTGTLSPSGDQYAIAAGPYEAVLTQSGGALRTLTHSGRALVDGFGADERSPGGRGQQLVPWPNRVRDGRFTFGGHDLQLALTEPARHNASHGLARWASWSVVEHTGSAVTLGLRLMAQTGWPWTLDLRVGYALTGDGLTVTQSVRNRSSEPAPYAAGAHPYLCVGPGPVDGLELRLPAARRYLTDERLLPIGDEAVAGTAYDFRDGRLVADTVLDDGFTELVRDEDGRARTTLLDRRTREGVELWVDRTWTCLQLFTADDVPETARRSLAVEPMSAPADALNSGTGLVVLEPGGSHSGSWGIRAL